VNCESVSYKFGVDHLCTAPSLDNRFLTALFHCSDLLFELHADKGAFF